MTASTIALTELAEKGADVDVLRQMVQFMAQRLMEIDVEGRCGAGYDEKSAESPSASNELCWTVFFGAPLESTLGFDLAQGSARSTS